MSSKSENKQKTVKVRIGLIVNADGKWSAAGWSDTDDEDTMFACAGTDMPDTEQQHEARYFITAEVALPIVQEVEAETVTAASEAS